MRKKELKLVITFHTTADAMLCERVCREARIPERLIPVPRTISAGCGMAWCAPPDEKARLEETLSINGIDHQDIHECLI